MENNTHLPYNGAIQIKYNHKQTNIVFGETSSTLIVSNTNSQLKIFLKIEMSQKLKLNKIALRQHCYSIKASF